MNNSLVLLRHGAPVAERVLGDEPVEIGRAASCDLVVDDPEIAARAFLVQARAGTVWLYDLARARLEPRILPLERPFALSAVHRIVRRTHVRTSQGDRHVDDLARATLPIDPELRLALARFVVLVGRGSEARRIALDETRPIRIGTAAHNELVLHDPTVSAEHCRLEPEGGQLIVRDLDSTNGTYVQGVRVARARLGSGAQLRLGRTDLQVLAVGDASLGEPALVAASAAMQALVAEARRFAQLSSPLLVLGPSGVGKEELAALVHRDGPRRRGPFVALNAGGLARELVESELFGHERGAFTGAHAKRRGVFEQADGGTLFLDEVGELPLPLQTRLLRVLETWHIRRVGGESDVPVDVRLVCATHRDLGRMVQGGAFRQDLYYRLARLVLKIAPLAARPDDVVPLAEHFVRALSPELGARTLSRGAEARLLAHAWPGNARELRNVLYAAAALSAASVLDAGDIERALARVSEPLSPIDLDGSAVERALARYGGNLSAASRALAIPRSTLRDRIRRAEQKPASDTTSHEPETRP